MLATCITASTRMHIEMDNFHHNFHFNNWNSCQCVSDCLSIGVSITNCLPCHFSHSVLLSGCRSNPSTREIFTSLRKLQAHLPNKGLSIVSSTLLTPAGRHPEREESHRNRDLSPEFQFSVHFSMEKSINHRIWPVKLFVQLMFALCINIGIGMTSASSHLFASIVHCFVATWLFHWKNQWEGNLLVHFEVIWIFFSMSSSLRDYFFFLLKRTAKSALTMRCVRMISTIYTIA